MSITVVKEKGVTVITMETDSESMLPPLCQILKNLCYSPICCSVNRGLMQSNAISALGTLQIMVGLFNIGFGAGRAPIMDYKDIDYFGAAYWLGAVFILTGIMSLIANRLPSACLLIFAVLMNIVGSIFAVVGIVLYAIDAAAAAYEYYDESMLTAMDVTMIVLLVLLLCVCISVSVLIIKALSNLGKAEGGRDDEIYQALMKEVPLTSLGA